MSWSSDVENLFGFGGDAWFERVREATGPSELGSLGPFRLLEEIGRGGQGVVFRAVQPGTGRVIAVKRLLAGSFASSASLRRFRREAEVATALDHPSIVTVYGVEVVDGAPLLAMEWVDGVPITSWASGRPREAVLAVFLQVCEAVQHAHLRGVLHRDLKPANVLVDRGGRPRVLDFGLAKLPEVAGSALTESGGFLGTPIYAAPEQLCGKPTDARTDVHALGVLLFELLTETRAVVGEGLEALAQVAEREPARPSSLVRTIPPDLDAIVLQAMALEPSRRYQSVDALIADLLRFLEDRPVLAHGPDRVYLLRKFVARNRSATAAVVLLVTATIVFGVVSFRQARHLKIERDRAVAAREREAAAGRIADRERGMAVAEKARAEERQRDAEQARSVALAAQATADSILAFLVDDVIAAADPDLYGPMPGLVAILEVASNKVGERFATMGPVEARVRRNLARSFLSLGAWHQAEREIRLSLQQLAAGGGDEDERMASEVLLGRVLVHLGSFEEARARFEEAVRRFDSQPDPSTQGLKDALQGLVTLARARGRFLEALAPLERLQALETDPRQRLELELERVRALLDAEQFSEAVARSERVLPEFEHTFGARSVTVGLLLIEQASCRLVLGDAASGDAQASQALGILEEAWGAQHVRLASPLASLSAALSRVGRFRDSLVLGERGLALMTAAAIAGPDRVDLLICVGLDWLQLARRSQSPVEYTRAAEIMAETRALCSRVYSPPDAYYSLSVRALHEALSALGRADEAEQLIGEAERLMPEDGPWLVAVRAMQADRAGNVEEAWALYEEALDGLARNPQDNWVLYLTLGRFSDLQRRHGDPEGARLLEQRAEKIRRGG